MTSEEYRALSGQERARHQSRDEFTRSHWPAPAASSFHGVTLLRAVPEVKFLVTAIRPTIPFHSNWISTLLRVEF